MKILLIFIFTLARAAGSEEVDFKKVELSQSEYNASLVDNSELKIGVNVKSLSLKKGDWVINGGYYSEKFKSLGYLKIADREINPRVSNGLSGILGIKPDGSVDVYWAKGFKSDVYSSALQNGPFLIDPGGKMGINSDDGKVADRVAVGIKNNGNMILVYARQITLYKLANLVHVGDSDISSLLNMDGGPMAGFWSFDDAQMQINNRLPAISYLKFSKK